MIQDAIVIHGPGRSGTTLLSNILSLHPDLGWISGYVNHYPYLPVLAVLNRLQDIPAMERFSRGRKKWPRPTEAYGFWDHFLPGFSSGGSSPKTDTPARSRPLECISTIESILRYSGKSRFITKITGLPRAEQLSLVFREPTIIYLNRDPRAVVMSYYKQRWGYKHAPDIFASISLESHIRTYADRYMASFRGAEDLKCFRMILARYEDMIFDKVAFFEGLLKSINLKMDSKFLNVATSWRIQGDTNSIWRNDLTAKQIEIVEDNLEDAMEKTGYMGIEASSHTTCQSKEA